MNRFITSCAIALGFLALGPGAWNAFSGEHGHGEKKHGKEEHKAGGEGHGHASPHGGIVKTIGDHHAELVFHKKDGQLELYILGENEKKAQSITSKKLTAQIKIHGKDDFHAVTLKAAPLKGEKEGSSSHFKGSAGFLKKAGNFKANLKIPVDGKTHRVTFDVKAGAHDKEHKKGEHHEEEHNKKEKKHDH